MPYSKKTHMLLRKERILKRIQKLNELLRASEEELEELEDVVRIKGPYKPQRVTRSSTCLHFER